MSKGKVGFGILGAGVIGRFHAEAIRVVADGRLVAVCDVVEDRARKLAEKDGVDYTTDYAEFLKRADIDVVNLCTPSSLHPDEAIRAAEAGKHVLTEKPMAVTLAGADRMIQGCRDAGVKLGCIFQRRVTEPWLTVKKALDKGELGKIVLADVHTKYTRAQEYYDSGDWRGTWEFDGGGALMNQGIHMIDLLLWCAGDVKRVFARSKTLLRKIEVEDTCVAALEFSSGAIGSLVGTTSVYPATIPHRLEFHGERGSIMIEGEGIRRWDVMGEDGEPVSKIDEDKKRTGKVITKPTDISSKGHEVLIQDMARAVIEDRRPIVTGEEARRVVELILAIYESERRKAEVELPLAAL